MSKPCETHHHACDCREMAVTFLLREVMTWHSDPTSPDYNGCEVDPCHWCAVAASLVGDVAPNSTEVWLEMLKRPELAQFDISEEEAKAKLEEMEAAKKAQHEREQMEENDA